MAEVQKKGLATVNVETDDEVTRKLISDFSKEGSEEPVEYKDVKVSRGNSGTIVLPKGMALEDAKKWIEREIQSEQKMMRFTRKMKAYPYDGAYSMYRAVKDLFGYVDFSVKEASGESVQEMVSIKLPNGEVVNVPWGKMRFPGLDDENSYLQTRYDSKEMMFEIFGEIRKKFEPVCNAIADKTEWYLRNGSIYKAQAIELGHENFSKNPDEFPKSPEFMNVSAIRDEDLIMSAVARMNYAPVMFRITKTKECLEKKIPLKHGVLLAGPYGTGKTMTARWTAKKSVENGWTFIYLKDCRLLKDALHAAAMYAPAVIFAEDIDKATEGERSMSMNDILNTLDGIDTKNNPVITILTTNHLENINKSFLRAGRIDLLIQMGPLDKEQGLQFIKRLCVDSDGHSILSPTEDYEKEFDAAAEALVGIVPAFASEVINKAKLFCLYEHGEEGKITPENIVTAAKSFKEHIALTEGVKEETPLEKLGRTNKEYNEQLLKVVES
jgi:transitional endoplasmic reticulum ATPase